FPQPRPLGRAPTGRRERRPHRPRHARPPARLPGLPRGARQPAGAAGVRACKPRREKLVTETETRYLVVGGGMTGDAACKGIREHDPDGALTLVGTETHPPYK